MERKNIIYENQPFQKKKIKKKNKQGHIADEEKTVIIKPSNRWTFDSFWGMCRDFIRLTCEKKVYINMQRLQNMSIVHYLIEIVFIVKAFNSVLPFFLLCSFVLNCSRIFKGCVNQKAESIIFKDASSSQNQINFFLNRLQKFLCLFKLFSGILKNFL